MDRLFLKKMLVYWIMSVFQDVPDHEARVLVTVKSISPFKIMYLATYITFLISFC